MAEAGEMTEMTEVAERTEDFLRRRAADLALPPTRIHDHRSETLLIGVGERSFAIDASRVREILPPGPLAGVPQGDHLLAGIRAALGGAVVVADVSALAGGGGAGDRNDCLCVVLDGPEPLGLLAETATAVERHDARSQLAPLGDLPGAVAPDGVVVLDVDAVLAHPGLRIAAPPPTTLSPHPGGTP